MAHNCSGYCFNWIVIISLYEFGFFQQSSFITSFIIVIIFPLWNPRWWIWTWKSAWCNRKLESGTTTRVISSIWLTNASRYRVVFSQQSSFITFPTFFFRWTRNWFALKVGRRGDGSSSGILHSSFVFEAIQLFKFLLNQLELDVTERFRQSAAVVLSEHRRLRRLLQRRLTHLLHQRLQKVPHSSIHLIGPFPLIEPSMGILDWASASHTSVSPKPCPMTRRHDATIGHDRPLDDSIPSSNRYSTMSTVSIRTLNTDASPSALEVQR